MILQEKDFSVSGRSDETHINDSHECEVGEDNNDWSQSSPKEINITSANTLAEEYTMMIKIINTYITIFTVICIFISLYITIRTIILSRSRSIKLVSWSRQTDNITWRAYFPCSLDYLGIIIIRISFFILIILITIVNIWFFIVLLLNFCITSFSQLIF